MAIITPTDITDYLALSVLSGPKLTAASVMIDGLVGDLEAFLGRPATIRTFTESPRLPDPWAGVIKLRNQPVRAISLLTANSVPITVYTFENSGLSSMALPTGGVYPPAISVTYTAGLRGDDLADDFGRAVRGPLLRVAARSWSKVIKDDAVGVSRIGVEGYSTSYEVPLDGWTRDELWSLSRWKLRR